MKYIIHSFFQMPGTIRIQLICCLASCIMLLAGCGHHESGMPVTLGEDLFRDDFDGAQLDGARWKLMKGRVELKDGIATLSFDTYNPDKPVIFLDTRIETLSSFPYGEKGVQFEARLRLGEMPDGMVPAFYSWMVRKVEGKSIRDEIDFEFLSKEFNHSKPGSPKVSMTSHGLTRFFLYGPTQMESTESIPVAGLDLHQFNVYTIRCLPGRTEWYVNGKLVRTYSGIFAMTAEPMYVHLSIWKPSPTWSRAYDGGLLPAKTPAENRRFTLDVDYVRVQSIR